MPPLAALQTLRLDWTPPLATITLQREAKYNALNAATLAELAQVLEWLRPQAELRAVVLTGAGTRAFAAGADIQELAGLDATQAHAFSLRGQAVFHGLETFPVPVIAALNGVALGGGLELALACTLRIAADHARLGQPEVKLGVLPGYGGTQRLPRLIGAGAALQMMLTGEPISAAEALRLGLVQSVVPGAELAAAAEACARAIAANAPLAVRYCLQAVRQGADLPLAAGLQLEAGLFALSCATEDMREGTRAFLEKRAPRFESR